jgi:hypothetical protein
MFFVHRQRCVAFGSKNTRSQIIGKSRYIWFVSGGELNKAGEVSNQGIYGGDVCKSKLAEGILKDGYTSLRRGRGVWSRVNCPDNLVNLTRNKRV